MATGWSPCSTSITAKRATPSVACSSAKLPSESGPRCSIVRHMRSATPAAGGRSAQTVPAIPHKVRARYLCCSGGVPAARPRLLAVVSRFKWVHIDYLAALGEHFDLLVAYAGEGGIGAPDDGIREGMRGVAIGRPQEVGADAVRAKLAETIEDFRPDLVHVMYYNHEDLTLMVRDLVGDLPVVFECRDPVTTLTGAQPGRRVLQARARRAGCRRPPHLHQRGPARLPASAATTSTCRARW